MHYDKVILGFAENLVPKVLDGTKTLTYRLGDKYDFLNVGDVFLIENSATKQAFAEVVLTLKEKTTFADLPIDRVGHETYSSKEEQRRVFEGFYKRPVADDEPVLILGFQVRH